MKKNNALFITTLLALLPLTSCGKDYSGIVSHKHTYSPSSLSWDWKEKSEGGFTCKVTATCSTCEENKDGHTISVDATVKGPTVVKENRCGVEGEVSYTASVVIQDVTYYQNRFVTTEAMEHEKDSDTLYHDAQYHWYQCKYCLKVMEKQAHDFTEYVQVPGSFVFERECKVCHYEDSYFSTDLFNQDLAKFDKTKITPFDKADLDEAKAIYESLSNEDKAKITNYKNVEDCYKVLEEFYPQWDISAGTVWTVLGNTIPGGHYISGSPSDKELLFEKKVDVKKGEVLSMEVKKDFTLSEDVGFYGNGFEKNLNYATGLMYIYCPEATQVVYINASTADLDLHVNLVKGWNRIDFNQTQWNKLNTQTYQQIRFTFPNKLKANSDAWLFTTAYGRILDVSELYNRIEALPSSIDDLKPYQLTELNDIKSQYDSLSDAAKAKVTNIGKVTSLLAAYDTKYKKTISGSPAWYELLGNTIPTNLYNDKKDAIMTVGTDSTERGHALTIKCKQTFTYDAGFYFDINKFSMFYDTDKVFSSLIVYVYSPCSKTIELRHRLNGESYNTGILKSFNCVEGWNELVLGANEIATMVDKTDITLKNTLAVFFAGGLDVSMGTFKVVVPYGVK